MRFTSLASTWIGAAGCLTISVNFQGRAPMYTTFTTCVGVWPWATTPKSTLGGVKMTSVREVMEMFNVAVETYCGPTVTKSFSALKPGGLMRVVSMVMSMVPVCCGWSVGGLATADRQPQ